MKIIIKKAEINGQIHMAGYDLVAESGEDFETLAIIRDSIFFGLNDNGTYPKYAGREGDDKHDVTILKFRKPKFENETLSDLEI